MLTIELDSDVPLCDQIVRGIRAAIAAGAVGPGDELPSVRQLAADLGINLNTVARAYRTLEGGGLVKTARGRGTRVLSASETRRGSAAANTSRIRAAVRMALADAKLAGLDRAAIAKLCAAELDRVWPPARSGPKVKR